MKLSRLALAIAPLALLAACGEDAPAPSEDSRAATGEVLEGTISDAMLPLDRVRSHPPLIAPRPRATSTAAEDSAEEEAPGGEEAGAAPEAAPAAGATPAEIVVPPAGTAAAPNVAPTPETGD